MTTPIGVKQDFCLRRIKIYMTPRSEGKEGES